MILIYVVEFAILGRLIFSVSSHLHFNKYDLQMSYQMSNLRVCVCVLLLGLELLNADR
jgi:hypothetical protein